MKHLLNFILLCMTLCCNAQSFNFADMNVNSHIVASDKDTVVIDNTSVDSNDTHKIVAVCTDFFYADFTDLEYSRNNATTILSTINEQHYTRIQYYDFN